MAGLFRRVEDELRGHRDSGFQASINRAFVGEKSVHASCSFAMRGIRFEPQPHVNPPNDEYVVFQFNLAGRFTHQTSRGCIDLTRLQRASKGSGQSTRCGRDDVIERCRTWFHGAPGNFIVLRNSAVHSENHRVRFGREIRFSNGSFDPLDADLGMIDDFRHKSSRSVPFALQLRRSALAIQSFIFEVPFERHLFGNVALAIVAGLVAEGSPYDHFSIR